MVFQVLGTPPNGNTDAAMALHNEGLDDPRITAVLLHAATEGKDPNAAAAVAQLHESSSSVKALFAALGTPPNTDSRMMNILTSMNVDDPRLMAAYIDQARHGSSDAILALGKYRNERKPSPRCSMHRALRPGSTSPR